MGRINRGKKTEKLSINKFVNSITISGKKISPEREKEIKKWLKIKRKFRKR